MPREKDSRRAAVTTKGDRNGRDRSGRSRTDRMASPPPPQPAGNGKAPPAEAPRLPSRIDRLLHFAEEHARRVLRRLQSYRRVRRDGPTFLGDWANERDVDQRIKHGDPIAVIDGLLDAVEGLSEAARAIEREHGI